MRNDHYRTLKFFFLATVALLTSFGLARPYCSGATDDAPPSNIKKYEWSLAVAPGEGNWPHWNLPVVAFDGNLWAVQDSRYSWSSRDGILWQRHKSNAGWGERYSSAVVFFQNKLWVLGGRNGPTNLRDYRNDVWSSGNGTDWKLETLHAAWALRDGLTALVHDAKLWVIGGGAVGAAQDAWFSPDGRRWTQAAATLPWPRDVHTEIFPFEGALWAIVFAAENQIWRTTDGVRWNRVAVDSPWGKMFHKDAVVFDGDIWVLGGADSNGDFVNDVWSSPDGLRWSQETNHAPWSPRAANYNVIFKDALWIYGGKNGKDDVWRLSARR
jgi:hypothetical protein